MNRLLNITLIFVLITLSNLTFSQIPLEIGNKWDFVDHEWDANGYNRYDTLSLKIYADTIISG